MYNKYFSIIIGAEHHNTLSIIRALGENAVKIETIIIGSRNNDCISKSKYIWKILYVKTIEEVIVYLRDRKLETTLRDTIICCSDDIVNALNSHYYLIKKYNYFNCGSPQKLNQYLNKLNQVKIAKKCGFNIPETYENIHDLQEQQTYIVKPQESSYGGKKIYISNSLDSLYNYINLCEHPVLIQEFIKIEYEIVIVGLSVGDKIIMPGYVHKLREIQGGTTYSSIHPIDTLNDKIKNATRNLIREIKYEGLFGIECVYNGKDFVFIEINLRNDATTYSLVKAGINLPLIYVKYNQKLDITNDLIFQLKEITSMVEFRDVLFVLKGKLSPIIWFKQLKKASCLYYYNATDIAPYKQAKRIFIRQIFNRLLKWI